MFSKIKLSLSKVNYKLFTALLVLGVAPTVYTTVRVFSLGQLPGEWSFSIAGQLSWVNLLYSSFLSRVPDGALGIGTGILSGFMLSSRLPKLKAMALEKIPEGVKNRLFPAIKRAKHALFGWLKAQCKLCAITFCVVFLGFLLLRIPYAPLWAAVVALVDAVPLLGTGTVLLPWALVSLLKHQHLRSVGLLCIYAGSFLTRTVLEPRLVGRHLGLDPLVTLVFLYLGYRFWGIVGMLLAPMLAAAITAATQQIEN